LRPDLQSSAQDHCLSNWSKKKIEQNVMQLSAV
jgi:hypothetical protein